MYIALSSGHILLNCNMSFKFILRRFEVVFWCLVWEYCTFWKIDGNSFKSTKYSVSSQIYYNNTRLQCAHCACRLGKWLTRPFHDENRRQSVFIYAKSYQSIKRERIFTSFIICGLSARWVHCESTGLVNYSGQSVQSLLAHAAPTLILVRAYLHKGRAQQAVLLRINPKAHEYWLPSVEITCRHDRMVESESVSRYCPF